ncbi:MAG: hypothetical protein AAF809_03425 [Bacteroidota bacterium]
MQRNESLPGALPIQRAGRVVRKRTHAEHMKTVSLLMALVMSSGLCFAQDAVGYDEFAQFGMEERIQVFNEIDLENQAAIVREQAQQWAGKKPKPRD